MSRSPISRSLSPSDESRFVPHSSVVGATTVVDSHFASSSRAIINNNNNNNNNKSHDPMSRGVIIADDEENSIVGLLGATICFTPVNSPRSSPNMEGVRDDLSYGNSSQSNNYIGSLRGYSTGDNSGVEGAVAGRMSCSAMQIASSLDGRSTTEYEILDGVSSKGSIEIDELSLDEESPNTFLPSINISDGDQDDNLGLTIVAESPLKMLYKEVFSEEQSLVLDDITVDRESKDGDSTSTSLKVDKRPLTPFNKVRKIWEDRSTVTGMIGRIVGYETSQDTSNSDVLIVKEVRRSKKQSLDPPTTGTYKPFAKVKDVLIRIAASTTLFVASANTFVVVIFCWSIGCIVSVVKSKDQYWLRNLGGEITRSKSVDELDTPLNKTASVEADEPTSLSGTDLSTLFLAEALNERQKTVIDGNDVTLDPHQRATLKTINDSVTAGIVNKYKQIMSSMKVVANRIVAKSSTSFIIGVIVMFTMLISVISWFRWSTDTPSVDDHHYCVSTKSSSFISIPLWELSLSPMFAGTSDVDFDAAPDEVGGQKSWLFSIIIFASIMILFIVKSQTPFNSTKPKIITGIWSELEHRQFIEGYNMHGKSWRLVSAFIPTRTEAQVRAHGCYWLKIHSPLTMKRTRKQEPTIFGSPSSVSSAMSTPKKSNKTLFLTPSKGILRVKNENQLPKQVVTPKSEGRASRMRQMEGSKSDPVKRVKIVSP